MDDPIDLRVSTTGQVHPNNEVFAIATCMCPGGTPYNGLYGEAPHERGTSKGVPYMKMRTKLLKVGM